MEPQELSSCLVTDGLVPSTGFLEDSRGHAVFTWRRDDTAGAVLALLLPNSTLCFMSERQEHPDMPL